MQTLTRELIRSLDDELKREVCEAAAFYEHRMHKGTKEIFHLEAFVAKFMALYKVFISLSLSLSLSLCPATSPQLLSISQMHEHKMLEMVAGMDDDW